jgi:uncharacterized protein YkwD
MAVAIGTVIAPLPALAGLRPSERVLLEVMNRARTARGLPPFQLDPRLERAARQHTRDMLRRGYFDHGAFARRMKHYGVRGRAVGENLAWWAGYAWARRVVLMWLESPPHRANLLRPGFRHVGVAALRGRFDGTKVRMVTADFAGR